MEERPVGQPDLRFCLQGALSKAFAANDPKVRAAYMDLANFYESQLRKTCGVSDPRQLHIR